MKIWWKLETFLDGWTLSLDNQKQKDLIHAEIYWHMSKCQ